MAAIDRASEERKKVEAPPHVVVVPAPAQGHINPMMQLSRKLAAHGVVVTFVNTQFNHERLLQAQAAAGISSHPQATGTKKLDIRLVGIPDGLGYEEYMVKYDVAKQLQAHIDMEPLLVKLVEDQKYPPVTCIIADVFLICTHAIAKRFGIPHVVLWTQSAASYAIHMFVTQNHTPLREKIFPEELHGEANERELITNIPGCPPLKLREVPSLLQAMDPSDFVFNCLMRNFNDVLDSEYVLMNTFEEIEGESLAAMANTPPKLVIGPMLPEDFVFGRDGDTSTVVGDKSAKMTKLGTSLWPENEVGCIPWLDLQQPNSVLYVSFGSIANMSPFQIQEFAHGLEASGWPFLMVLRPELTIGSGAATILLTTFMERMRSHRRAAFVEWAPQLEILAHPAVGGFLTHSGWNSTLESICMGVPMLCWPYFADQMINCRCVVDAWKVGLCFSMEGVEEENANNHTKKGDDIDCKSRGNNHTEKGDDSFECNSEGNDNDNVTKVPIVTRHEIESKVKQLMDPDLSKEIRERASTLSVAAKEAYKGPSQRNLKSLLNFLLTLPR